MDKSVFTIRNQKPDNSMLQQALGETCILWESLHHHVHSIFPGALDEWNYPGEKYGWSLRIKDKKRAIIYLLPRDAFFKAAFVFGQRATDLILKSNIAASIKTELESARVYAEGRGIRIEVKDDLLLKDIKQLIEIKLAH